MTTEEPRAIDDYLAEVEPEKRPIIAAYYARVPALVPDAVVGRSYAMPAYLYRGKGLVSVMATKAGLSVIPFSGAVAQRLPGLDTSEKAGSIRVSVADLLPDDVFDEVVRLRRAEIDATAR
ncbi:DUF1801 domain-containing protein [Nocardioides sp. CER19]|uniref:iron chaperone n=1 Tax=Nocardioides sp. CER19 TaxID=3038538 RepID=UPI0024474CBE|nr:DUF1801 domain-containing protein [Nocardioides sp. CER19]MDH2416361.1 DUF1801 domain-containing protein [Nocardioides sp. CER19]